MQVKQPWLLLQYGNSDVESIGADRVESLLSTSPNENLSLIHIYTALATLFPVFLLVVLLFHIRQIAGTNWQEVSLSQIAQDINIPYLLSLIHICRLWIRF